MSLLYFKPFYVYILYSRGFKQYYIGHTENLEDRIFRHINSGSKSTKKTNDCVLKYTDEFGSRLEAMHRELEIKKRKVENILYRCLAQLAKASRMLSGSSCRWLSGLFQQI